MTHNSKIVIVARAWIVPVVISGLIFAMARPVVAETLSAKEIHGLYMASVGVSVGTTVEGSYSQIEYEFEGKKTKVTEGNRPHVEPDADGEFIVWREEIGNSWQIFRHSLITNEIVQLTSSGNNTSPVVSGKWVAWRGWVGDLAGGWQIFVFDGKSVEQVSFGNTSVEPDIGGNWLVYRQKTNDGTGWLVKVMSLVTGAVTDLGEGAEARFEGEVLSWSVGGERGSYDFGAVPEVGEAGLEEPSPTPEVEVLEQVSEEEVAEELEAPVVGEVEELELPEEASESGELE